MQKNTSYSLPKDSKAWQQAGRFCSLIIAEGTNLHDFDALQSLPVFALIVVLPTHVSSLDIHQYVQSWSMSSQTGTWSLSQKTPTPILSILRLLI